MESSTKVGTLYWRGVLDQLFENILFYLYDDVEDKDRWEFLVKKSQENSNVIFI